MTDKCGHDGLRKMDFIRPAPPVIRPSPQTALYSLGEQGRILGERSNYNCYNYRWASRGILKHGNH